MNRKFPDNEVNKLPLSRSGPNILLLPQQMIFLKLKNSYGFHEQEFQMKKPTKKSKWKYYYFSNSQKLFFSRFPLHEEQDSS